MTKALFFPNYLGGGFGHIGRCLALAEAWTRRGGQAVFALNGPHQSRVARAGYETHAITTPRMPRPSSSAPAYVYFADMTYQLIRDGFDHPRIVERALAEAMQIVGQVRPDVLVGDGWPLTRLVAHRANLPLVQLVKSVAHPQPERLVWWEEPPDGLMLPDSGPVFNPVLAKIGLPVIRRPEELLAGDLLLLPSIPPLDPMSVLPANTHYVGPLIQQSPAHLPDSSWLATLDGGAPVVYVTVGGAAGHGASPAFFRLVVEALRNSDCQVVVSTGGKVDPQALGPVPSNIHLERWVPNTEMLVRSSVVVFHGGYTRLEILKHGLPSVVIPFHSEQEYYGRLMAEAGVAVLTVYSDEPYRRVLTRWRGGNWLKSKRYTWHVRLQPTLQPQTLRAAIDQALSQPALRSKAQAMQSLLATYGGSEQALDLVEAHLVSLNRNA